MLQLQFQESMEQKVKKHGEMLKKLEKQHKEFYWLPDLSLAGFATKRQIKKNYNQWSVKVNFSSLNKIEWDKTKSSPCDKLEKSSKHQSTTKGGPRHRIWKT